MADTEGLDPAAVAPCYCGTRRDEPSPGCLYHQARAGKPDLDPAAVERLLFEAALADRSLPALTRAQRDAFIRWFPGVLTAARAGEQQAVARQPAPSAEDREALRIALTDGYWQRTGYRTSWEHLGTLIDVILDAGFTLATRRPAPVDAETTTALAQDIREVDGSHSLGAAALADALIERGWRRG